MEMVATVEFKRYMTGVHIFGVGVSKLGHW